jgi:hypothetical protein
LLELDVFCDTPKPEAETLLGDLLFAGLPADQRKKYEEPAMKKLQVEALLLRRAVAGGAPQ